MNGAGQAADSIAADVGSLQAARARRERWLAGFVVIAPACAVALALALWKAGIGPSRVDVAVFAGGSLATMVGVEVGYHRYFTHRAFEARRWFAWLLGALGSSAFLGPVIWWAATHRRHHAHADREGDPHSPNWPHAGVRGLWHGHVGWLFDPMFTAMSLSAGKMKDLWSNGCAVGTQRLYLVWGALGLALPLAIGALAGGTRGALTGLLWGGFARIFVVSHLVWGINSLSHRFGGRAAMPHSGRATNHLALVVPTLGGGLHANHHDSPRAYTTRAIWWQLDLGGALVGLLARVGVVHALKARTRRDEPANGDEGTSE